MKRILIATDGSTEAGYALEQGLTLADDVGGDAIVVYVRPSPTSLLGAPYYQDVITEEARHAEAVIAEAKVHGARYDAAVDYEVIEGDAVEAVIDLARARDVDLIVVGSRGLGVIKGLLLGSVSSGILHRADRPVLVTRTPSGVAAAA
jgi:nucleotide-binding universal stress UspA family protein